MTELSDFDDARLHLTAIAEQIAKDAVAGLLPSPRTVDLFLARQAAYDVACDENRARIAQLRESLGMTA